MTLLFFGAAMLLVLTLRSVAAGGDEKTEVADLAWMAGTWEGEQGGVWMREHWTQPKGDAMLGLHQDVAGGHTVSFEFLRIEKTPKGIVYFASPKGAPATPFGLIETKEKRVVFENAQHDFPQRILYWLGSDGMLHARIEGTMSGKAASEEWTWKRTS